MVVYFYSAGFINFWFWKMRFTLTAVEMTIWQYHIRWLKLIFAGLIVCKKKEWQLFVQLHLHLTEENHSAFLVKARQWKVGSPTQHLLVVVAFLIWLCQTSIFETKGKQIFFDLSKRQVWVPVVIPFRTLAFHSVKVIQLLLQKCKLSSFSCKGESESCQASSAKVKVIQFLLQKWKLSSFSFKSESYPVSNCFSIVFHLGSLHAEFAPSEESFENLKDQMWWQIIPHIRKRNGPHHLAELSGGEEILPSTSSSLSLKSEKKTLFNYLQWEGYTREDLPPSNSLSQICLNYFTF